MQLDKLLKSIVGSNALGDDEVIARVLRRFFEVPKFWMGFVSLLRMFFRH